MVKLNLAHKKQALLAGILLLSSSAYGYANTAIEQALSNPNRPSHELILDKVRKPAQVLEFFQLKPEMDVIDVFSGPGYYTELLSHLVGKNGSVAMHNHSSWEAYSKKGSDARIKNNRLPNVYQVMQDLNNTKLTANHFDAATIFLGIHDMFLASEKSENGDKIDVNAFFNALYKSIKPGGIVGIVEHQAKKGADPVKSAELHRTDSSKIIEIMTTAGFTLEAQSNILRNYQDDHTQLVFDKSIRWQTDRVVLRFKKSAL